MVFKTWQRGERHRGYKTGADPVGTRSIDVKTIVRYIPYFNVKYLVGN